MCSVYRRYLSLCSQDDAALIVTPLAYSYLEIHWIIRFKGYVLDETMSAFLAHSETFWDSQKENEKDGAWCVYSISSLWLGLNKRPCFLPHNTPRRLFLVLGQQRRMKDQPQRKECGSCCGLGGSWASRCGGRVSAFWHWVAPGVHDSGSAAGKWV